ncbi:eukaryotic translation initiation factor 3 subunit H [Haematococcus lacustris]|uniref:Eukaryotic translation initiation factor 3 subunit H n=1 Tax=Haematococcus lacustris TaxID=44745 RepID=A0A699ZCI4_HAELA|nr:eukaryotic translation initiation factor 3 subunit H [Haematococcus lacustris]
MAGRTADSAEIVKRAYATSAARQMCMLRNIVSSDSSARVHPRTTTAPRTSSIACHCRASPQSRVESHRKQPANPASMATVQGTAAKRKELKYVELSGQVVMKVLQHCNDASPQVTTGQLLGLDVGSTLEVTDCFPFPASTGDELEEDSVGVYQLEIMRCLREVNVDNNTVGWYQSAVLGTYQTSDLIDTFINYHDNIKNCVCLIYDPQSSQRGSLALQAIRLKDSFIELYKQDKLTAKDMVQSGVSWRDVFVDIPIKIANLALTQALITELQSDGLGTAADYDRLSLSTQPYVEKSIQSLLDQVDDLIGEQQKVTMYHKNVARHAQSYASWLAKRRQDNVTRRAAGEEALPEDDPAEFHKEFKPPVEPSLLDSYLICSQMSTLCDQLNVTGNATLEKLYVMDALQKAIV